MPEIWAYAADTRFTRCRGHEPKHGTDPHQHSLARHAGREESRAGEAVLMARSSRTDTRGLRPSRCGVRSSGALIRCNIALYRFPDPERIAVGLSPERRLQLLRRWLDKF
jgi:hypothetical protein